MMTVVVFCLIVWAWLMWRLLDSFLWLRDLSRGAEEIRVWDAKIGNIPTTARSDVSSSDQRGSQHASQILEDQRKAS
jgi:hypothetical protein